MQPSRTAPLQASALASAHPLARYAELTRPVIDRVYNTMRRAAAPLCREVIARTGLNPGFISSFYFGLLARPMPAASFAAATTYSGSDMTEELAQGIATVDPAGTWTLTAAGRDLALAWEEAVAAGAEEFWAQQAIATMPGLTALPRLASLLEKLLDAGAASGGPAFAAMAPVHEPANASPALLVGSRLGALRHHRADAHRAAWQPTGLTIEQLRALPADDPQRIVIEDSTNQRDSLIYQALSDDERLELLALLGSLPG